MNIHPIRSLRRLAFACLAILSFTSTPTLAQSSSADSSMLSVYASGLVVSGAPYSVFQSGAAIVESVKVVGESLYMVLKSPVDASVTTIKLSTKALGATSVVAGESIQVVANAAGSLLVYAGKLLAIIPNEVGKSLVHHSTH